jgi:hypothetical protein
MQCAKEILYVKAVMTRARMNFTVVVVVVVVLYLFK